MLDKHKKVEKNSMLLLVLVVIVVSVGGLVEAVPLFRIQTTIEKV
ncbi:MAG: cytochrome c oxidase, cbb3-type, subunit, partial [Alphaproteobacteria bacterium]|nr:cytochrome c oxidase, cbb3-type, subunit [Alphaproteobacteria bacterium]